MSGRIFLSYRRADSPHATGRIYDRLCQKFDPDDIFFDIDKIILGADFVERIEESVGACDLMLVVIGPDWLGATDANGERRLDQPGDYVRLEIIAALKRDIPLIPVFVEDARAPREEDLPEPLRPLARRHGARIGHVGFAPDVEQLIRGIQVHLRDVSRRNIEEDLQRHRSGPQPDPAPGLPTQEDPSQPRGPIERHRPILAPDAIGAAGHWAAPVRHLLPTALRSALIGLVGGFAATHGVFLAYSILQPFVPYDAGSVSLIGIAIGLCWGAIGAIICTLAGPSVKTMKSAAAGWAIQILAIGLFCLLFDSENLWRGLLHFGVLLGPVGALLSAVIWRIWSHGERGGLLN